MRIAALIASFLAACTGIPDADPPIYEPKPCDIVITDGNHVQCVTREEFQRWLKRNGL